MDRDMKTYKLFLQIIEDYLFCLRIVTLSFVKYKFY